MKDSSDKTKGVVILNMDPRLESLMGQKHRAAAESSSNGAGTGTGKRSVQGYRVQVFSSNQRTAKTDAQGVVQQLRSKMPKLPVYVSFQSPFWKVRVGNCETTTEAQQLRSDMKNMFPEFASEIYIVKGKVNVE
ncbi:MAG: SPOR domain-containing protein [Paludibacteraceae bacterium]|nr:SPOR domain-containing protein [Paludibacteraceae bacterium]MBP5136734.1 SPOR domain-containing protein [Paludibacteraceae bacterium]MBP5742515.1 SPOR domain-containing protein [Paludibacteraceae bacterium]